MNLLLVSQGVHERMALETLVQRLLSPRQVMCSWREINDPTLHAHHGKGQGFYKRAVRWMLQTQKEGFDGLVLLIDEDNDPRRVREIDDAQASQISNLPRALGVAIRSFDAWMLSDETALTTVLDYRVDCQPSPERNRDPKQSCLDLLSQSRREMRPRDMYKSLTEIGDLNRLSERCPDGFAKFAARVRAL